MASSDTRQETTVLRRALPWLLLCIPAVLLYAPFLSSPLFFDDLNAPVWDYPVQWPEGISLRVVALWTLLLSSFWPEIALQTLRGGNVLVHVCNVLMLYVLAKAVFRSGELFAGREARQLQDRTAWLGALLFSVHPVATYATGYMIQRTILLATFFALLTVWAHHRAQTSGNSRWFGVSVLAFLLSLFSKEHVVMLPFVLAFFSYWLDRRGFAWKRSWSGVFVAYCSSSLLVVVLAKSGVGFGGLYEYNSIIAFQDVERPHLVSVFSQLIFFFQYLGLWLGPFTTWMSVDIQQDVPYYAVGWPGGLAGLAILAISLILLRYARSWLLTVGWFWALLLFFTEFWAIRLSESVVLYRSYLWMIPVPFGVAWLVVTVGRRFGGAAFFGLVAIVFGGYVVGTLDRLQSMSSPINVWTDAVEKNRGVSWPLASRAHNSLGTYFDTPGQLLEAQTHFLRAVQINPRHVHAWCNLSKLHWLLNNDDIAEAMYFRALSVGPREPCVHELFAERMAR